MNSFASILQRMKDDIAPPLSTMEGSFAGDVLGAMANELARIHSQEIDQIAARAFVTTAEGQWLDAACADYGFVRGEGESDASLRARTLFLLQQRPSSGNEAHYCTWALEVPGIVHAQAFGTARGAGTVDLYVAAETQEAQTPVLLMQVQAHVETLRPVGVDVQVAFATPVPIEVVAALRVAAESSLSQVLTEFSDLFTRHLADTTLSQAGGTLSPHRIAALLLSCAGVLDIDEISLNEQSGVLTLSPGQYGVPGAVRLSGVPA